MGALINVIRREMDVVDATGSTGAFGAFMQFWMALTLTYMRSSSLPLRLFAWGDQVLELIDTARRHRPKARYVTSPSTHACTHVLNP